FTGGGTAGLKVLSNGSVGIGTTTTNAKLHVSSEENGDAIFILSADTGNKSEENNPWMEFTQDGGLVSSQFGFTGNIAGNAFARQISGGMTNAMILNTTGTSPIQFSASSTVALTIDGTTRKIGIGTTTPSTLLHLASSDSNNTAFRIDNTSSGASWGIWVTGTSSSIGESKFNIYDYKNAASRLSINTSGQVGIGSTEPVHALDVYGDCIAFMGSCIGANSPTNIVEYVGTVFQYGEDGAIANALTRFMPTLGGTIATSDILSNVVTRNGILRNFYVQADANSLNGPTTFEVFKNGAASGFTVVLGANQTAASATNNSLIVSAGDRISLRVVTTGTGTLTRPSASFEHMMSTNVFSASQWITSTTTPSNIFFETGNVGIGTQSPLYKLDVRGNFGAGSANLTSFFVDGTSGKIGIGTTTPTAFLTASGTVRFSTLVGNGANLVVDTLGNVTVSSDERLKDIQGMFEKGLEQIKLLNPILFKWKPETGYEASSTYAGFSAQNVQSAIPEAVATDTQGFLTLADRPILAALVNAVKELAGKIEGFAEVVKTKDMETNRMCMKKQDGNTVCVTAEQLERVLGGQGIVNTTQSQAVSPVSVEATSTISEDEIIDAVPPPQDSLVLPASEEDK
ncbi:MAG: tail fiber domain-containing protein, partial [Patescibacteria group bacterium]